jgi:hypothetical protein
MGWDDEKVIFCAIWQFMWEFAQELVRALHTGRFADPQENRL